MVRSLLTVTTGVALGIAVGASCKIPDTLGLPCETDAHCDGLQVCRQGICALPTDDTGSTTAAPTTTDPSTTSGVVVTSSTSDGTETTAAAESSTTSAVAGSSSSGGVCGVGECTDVDLLIVLDTSPSMYQWLLPLAGSIDSLVTLVSDQFAPLCTFHVGVTTGELAPDVIDPPCDTVGSLLRVPDTCSAALAGQSWVGSEMADIETAAEIMRCMLLDVGLNGPNDEHMLEAMVASVDPANNAAGACNDGFRRPDANLMVVYLSDEDDPTPQSELDTFADEFNLWVDGTRAAFIGVVADDDVECPWDPNGHDDDGSGTQLPTKLNGFLALTTIPLAQRATIDICEMAVYDFADAFGVLGTTCNG